MRSALKDAHRILIQAELGCGEMLRETAVVLSGFLLSTIVVVVLVFLRLLIRVNSQLIANRDRL